MTPREMLEMIDDDGYGLTDWEINFIDDMLRKTEDAGYQVTEAQANKIRDIFDERV